MEAALNTPSGRTTLGPTPVRIGRAPDNTIVLTDPEASSHHVEIAPGYRGNGYQITDLNSTNGTFVNEQRMPASTPRPLSAGDVIRIGQTRISYEVTGSYIPTVPSGTPAYEPTVPASPDPYLAAPVAPQPSPPPIPYAPPQSYPSPTPAAYPAQAAYPPPAPAAYPAQAYPPPAPAAYPAQAAYPQYPQSPQYPQYPSQSPYQAAPKKGRAGCVVVIVLVLLVLLGGGGAYLYLQNRSTPQKTLAAYCDGWKTGNAQEIYDQLSTHAQSGNSVADVQKVIDSTKLVGGVTACTVSDVTENGSTATGIVTLTLDGKATHAQEDLVQQNGVWKIDNSTNSSANSL